MNKKYYIKTSETEFKEQKAKKYHNNFNLDLFQFTDNHGTNISEGQTGMKLFTGDITEEGFSHRIEKLGGIEFVNALITANIKLHGLSPRYL